MKSKILIVEDEFIEAMSLEQSLKSSGYEVVGIASTGEEAIQNVSELKPDLVLMDIVLKGEINSIEAAAQIKDNFDIPVIYLAVHPDESAIKRANHTSPYGYLIKPISKTDLKITVELAIYKHQMEKNLKESEEKYRWWFDDDITGDFIATSEGRILECNPKFLEIYGFENHQKALKHNISKFNPTDWSSLIKRLKQERKIQDYQSWHLRSDNQQIHVVGNLTGVFNDLDELIQVKGYFFDDTKRKNAEDELNQAIEEWERTFNAVPDLISIIDNDYRILHVNKAMADRLGVEPDDCVGLTCFETVHNSNNPPALCPHRQLLDDGLEHTNEIHEEQIGGDFIVSVSPIHDNEGNLIGSVHIARDITERKKMEKALRESERLFSDMIDFLPDATFAIDSEGKVIAWNRAVEEMTGVPKKDMLAKGNYEHAIPWYGERRPVLIDLIDEEEFEYWSKYDFIKKEGQTLKAEVFVPSLYMGKGAYVWVKASPLMDSKGRQYGAIESVRDITDIKKAEEALKKSEHRFRAVAESAVDGIVTTDADGKILFCNNSVENIFGYPHKEIIGKSLTVLMPDRSKDYYIKGLRGFKVTGKHLRVGKTLITTGLQKNGTEFPFEMSLSAWKSGERTYFTSIIRDITDRKIAEEELKSNQWRLEMGMEIANLVYWEYDVEEDMFTFNDNFYSLYGTSAQEEGGYQMSSTEYATCFLPPEEQALVGEEVAKALETDDPNYTSTIQHSIIRRDGERRDIIARIRIRLDEDGRKIGTNGVNQDITELINAEKALKESEEQFKFITNNMTDVIGQIDSEGNITYISPSIEELTGFKPNYFIGKPAIADTHPDDQKKIEEAIQLCILNRKEMTIEYRALKSDDDYIWVEATGKAIYNDSGDFESIIFSKRDISTRRKAEDAIKASLKEKETLLKEIHHRVKNNLQIISSLLDLQEGYVREDPTAMNVLEESKNRVMSMSMIHEMIYQSKDLSYINFADYIKNLTSNLFHSYDANSNITSKIDVEEINLNIETSVPLGLIISELVSNTLKYAFTDKIGELLISLHSEGEDFKLIVSDNGIGLPKTLDFRNSESTLGLSLVNLLVKQLDGSIELDKSHGTKFTIQFKEQRYEKRV